MELVKGRPENTEGRLAREIRVYDFLDELKMDYWRVDHEPAWDMHDCQGIDKVLDTVMCKNLFLCTANKKHFYLLMMPEDKVFKTKDLSKQIGSSRLSFAKPEYMLAYLDIEPGAVSIMGLINDKDDQVQLLIDEELLTEEYIGCHPCVNTSSLKIFTKDIMDIYLPAVHHAAIPVSLPENVE